MFAAALVFKPRVSKKLIIQSVLYARRKHLSNLLYLDTIARMNAIAGILPYAQITLAVLLIGSVLLQQTGSSLGGAFGGDNFSAGFHTRRGFEKLLFNATIVIATLFGITAFLALII
jgi:preprotein translocase subunit SecG